MPIKVQATRPGFYKSYRAEGEEFTLDKADQLGSWMRKVTKANPATKAKKAKDTAPETFTEVNKTLADQELGWQE